jgi:glyoxylase-like metal-dependent hydrolase (beta-lactamase superfamily II)
VAISRVEEHREKGARIKIEVLDLDFMGAERVTASFLLLGEKTAALVESGPTTCLESLMGSLKEHGVAPEDVQQVFLTHIHLDHAGASGHLAGLLPNATFYVHEIGYPHLVDPSKLLKSATRIYGQRMDELWGEVHPIQEYRLTALSGGEEMGAADGILVAHHTPGHAPHHLAYHEPQSKTLFAGDMAGIRLLAGSSHVRPPTSPPEFDPQAWQRSIALIRRLKFRNLALTHFGAFEDVDRHLEELQWRLREWLLFVEQRVDGGYTKDEITDHLRAKANAELLAEGAGPDVAERYELAGSMGVFVDGLLRYFKEQPA